MQLARLPAIICTKICGRVEGFPVQWDWVIGTLEQDSYFSSHLAELGFPEDGSTRACHGKSVVNSLFCFVFFHLYNHRITLSIIIWIVVNPVQFSVQKSKGILKIFFLIYASSKERAQSCLMYISQLYSKSPNKTRSMSPTQLLQ